MQRRIKQIPQQMNSGVDSKRKMVSVEQLNSLLEFMKEHPDLAKGLSRGRRGKLMNLKVWNSCANRLNSLKEGAVKDGKGWSKYWCDWKYRVRRHALELKGAKDNNSPILINPLSSIEEAIMSIIGEDSLNEVQIKMDPLANEDSNEDVPESSGHDIGEITIPFHANTSQNRKRRKDSTRETSFPDEDDNCDYSPPKRKARDGVDAEDEDVSMQFLRLEREKVELCKNMSQSLQSLVTQLTRLTDAVEGRLT